MILSLIREHSNYNENSSETLQPDTVKSQNDLQALVEKRHGLGEEFVSQVVWQ